MFGSYGAIMVVTPISKCNQCLLIWRPVLYKEKYIAAFSDESDPNQFANVYDNEDEAVKFLWDSYTTSTGKSFGGWNQFGCIPQHTYCQSVRIIIIPDCAEVMAKKGQ